MQRTMLSISSIPETTMKGVSFHRAVVAAAVEECVAIERHPWSGLY
jgi:hypothetical protein